MKFGSSPYPISQSLPGSGSVSPWLEASRVFEGFVNAFTRLTEWAPALTLSSSPRDCFSFGGSEPLSNTEIRPPGWNSASCCQ